MTLPRTGPRVVVRVYRGDDLDDVARVLGDPELVLTGDHALSRDEAAEWLRDEIACERRDGTGRYAVALRETGEVVGGCGLVRRELDSGVEYELGYHLRSDLWGRGLATEAASLCLDEARERGYPRVIAFIEEGSERSERVARRLGLQPGDLCEWFGHPHRRWAVELGAAP